MKHLRRVMDAHFLNEIANDPEVRPYLGGGEGVLDLTPLCANPANVCLTTAGGGWIMHAIGPGRYEVHSLFPPGGREGLMTAMREGLRYMFCATDCTELVSKAPASNGAAIGLARAAGFKERFRRPSALPSFNEPVAFFSLPLEAWMWRDEELKVAGEWFHERLERALGEVPHDEDEAHNRAVGLAVTMLRAGNPVKAVAFYNKWAVFAGYAPIALLSERPVIVDVVSAVIGVNGDDMEVLACRQAQH